MHPALHLSAAHSKGDFDVARLNGTPHLVTRDVWIFRRGPLLEFPLAACDETPKRYGMECRSALPKKYSGRTLTRDRDQMVNVKNVFCQVRSDMRCMTYRLINSGGLELIKITADSFADYIEQQGASA